MDEQSSYVLENETCGEESVLGKGGNLKKTFSLVWVETSNQIVDLLGPLVFWRFVDMLTISSSEYREMCKIEGYHESRK